MKIPSYLKELKLSSNQKQVLFNLISNYFDEVDPYNLRTFSDELDYYGESNYIVPWTYSYYDGNLYSVKDALLLRHPKELEDEHYQDLIDIIEYVLSMDVTDECLEKSKLFFSSIMLKYIKEFLNDEISFLVNKTEPTEETLKCFLNEKDVKKVLFIKNSLKSNVKLYLNEFKEFNNERC